MTDFGEIVDVAPEPCPQCGQTMDCHALDCKLEAQRKLVFNRTWFVKAEWAHPMWQHYIIMLVDLTTPIAGYEPKLISPDMTHELLVFALLPNFNHMYPEGMVSDEFDMKQFPHHPFLSPANHVYQFAAANNERAEKVGKLVYKLIKTKTLNPDTDARRAWDALQPLGHNWKLHGHTTGISFDGN